MTNPPHQNPDKSSTLNPDKSSTLKPQCKCDTCGEPAMVVELDRFFSCLECYLEMLCDKIKRLDRVKNYH